MGRRGLAPANRGRRHVLQIGPISKHQPTENNRRNDVRPVGEAHENTDEDEIDDQVKDFLKELQEDDDQQPSAAAEAPSQQVPTYDSNSVWHECLDPSTQHVYYWNTVTDEVTWTFPENGTVSVAPAAGAGAATEEQTAVEVTCEPGPSGSAVQLRGEASGTTSSTDEHGSDGHLEEMDDDSDCNIENYDDDDDDDKDDDNDNEGTAQTRLADWQAGALDGAYAVQMLEASVGELQNYEEACAPPGWQCLWDSSASRYYYHEIATGTTSWNYPSEIAKLAPQQSYGLSGLDEMAAAAFAGAMAATYHGYIYGGYQAMYTPGVSQQPVAYAPPLPVEELPPPPPGVDDPPMPSDPPPPPPPPDDNTDDDDQPPTPGDEPPPLPPGVELQGPSADVSNSEAKGDTKAEGPVVIQAAPAIIKRAAVVDSQPNSPSGGASTDFKISTDDPLQMRMRATLLARGMSEADVKEYFIQEALKQQLQQSGSQPASPKTTAVGKSKEKKKKKDKSAKHGLAPKKQKNMASLVNKWDAIRQKELEEENAGSDEEDPVKVQQRKIQEWKASQMAGGGAHNNPNFEEVSGDWRDRIKRSR